MIPFDSKLSCYVPMDLDFSMPSDSGSDTELICEDFDQVRRDNQRIHLKSACHAHSNFPMQGIPHQYSASSPPVTATARREANLAGHQHKGDYEESVISSAFYRTIQSGETISSCSQN